MVTSRAPAPDLALAHFPTEPRAREDLYFRWTDRVVRELVPSALEDVAHRDEAEELRRRLPAPIGRGQALTVFEVCRDVCHRL
jgi:hypothetical protein